MWPFVLHTLLSNCGGVWLCRRERSFCGQVWLKCGSVGTCSQLAIVTRSLCLLFHLCAQNHTTNDSLPYPTNPSHPHLDPICPEPITSRDTNLWLRLRSTSLTPSADIYGCCFDLVHVPCFSQPRVPQCALGRIRPAMAIRYSADDLLHLRASPLCSKPDRLPPAEEWVCVTCCYRLIPSASTTS